jgi:hypothetical protein
MDDEQFQKKMLQKFPQLQKTPQYLSRNKGLTWGAKHFIVELTNRPITNKSYIEVNGEDGERLCDILITQKPWLRYDTKIEQADQKVVQIDYKKIINKKNNECVADSSEEDDSDTADTFIEELDNQQKDKDIKILLKVLKVLPSDKILGGKSWWEIMAGLKNVEPSTDGQLFYAFEELSRRTYPQTRRGKMGEQFTLKNYTNEWNKIKKRSKNDNKINIGKLINWIPTQNKKNWVYYGEGDYNNNKKYTKEGVIEEQSIKTYDYSNLQPYNRKQLYDLCDQTKNEDIDERVPTLYNTNICAWKMFLCLLE